MYISSRSKYYRFYDAHCRNTSLYDNIVRVEHLISIGCEYTHEDAYYIAYAGNVNMLRLYENGFATYT